MNRFPVSFESTESNNDSLSFSLLLQAEGFKGKDFLHIKIKVNFLSNRESSIYEVQKAKYLCQGLCGSF